jgi:hypothetical protein
MPSVAFADSALLAHKSMLDMKKKFYSTGAGFCSFLSGISNFMTP